MFHRYFFKTKNFYKDIANDVEKRFDTFNYDQSDNEQDIDIIMLIHNLVEVVMIIQKHVEPYGNNCKDILSIKIIVKLLVSTRLTVLTHLILNQK